MSTRPQPQSGEFRPGYRREVSPRPGRGRGRLLYYLVVRVTGVMLAVLVLGHFALTHFITDVADTGSEFIARRWGSVFWLLWDWAMLATAMLHGAAGVWIGIEDYTPDERKRKRRQRLLVLISALLFIVGLITMAVAMFA